VVGHEPVSRIWWNTAAVLVVLLLNYPLHMYFSKLSSLAIRRTGTELRGALCHRMQHLSIGYHSRVSAEVLQTKVVRDVDAL
ncbi:ABC transporter ATP-binding protein, partial [Streptomyces sp. SID11233]|nr:ABC transporter ATP-binding protein [Streptomyces sp. SID11233]